VAWVEYEKPNPYLYTFSGCLNINETNERLPLDASNFVLRGCSIRNTGWVVGVCLYSGHDTKIMLNSIQGKSKHSNVEHSMSR